MSKVNLQIKISVETKSSNISLFYTNRASSISAPNPDAFVPDVLGIESADLMAVPMLLKEETRARGIRAAFIFTVLLGCVNIVGFTVYRITFAVAGGATISQRNLIVATF